MTTRRVDGTGQVRAQEAPTEGGDALNGLDLCAGSGIGSAAFEAIGFCRTVCYVERDAYCQRLLQQRMQDGWLSPAPIWDDLQTFDGRPWRGLVDFVFGGIPCQPHSLAGNREGGADERDLWPDFWRVVREVGPSIVLVENVPGLLSSDGGRFLGRILGDLASGGYDAEWDCIPAAAVGAPHRRDRVWVVAYAGGAGRQQVARSAHGDEGADEGWTTSDVHEPAGDGEGLRQRDVADAECSGRDGRPWQLRETGRPEPADGGIRVADDIGARLAQRQGIADDAGPQQQAAERGGDGTAEHANADGQHVDCAGHGTGAAQQQQPAGVCDSGGGWWWESEPDVGRVADGVASRVDRLRTIGNGWVPQVAAVVAGRIAGSMRSRQSARKPQYAPNPAEKP